MKVGERLSELRSYFQRTPNPVRGPPMLAQPRRSAFPEAPVAAEKLRRGVVAAGADDGVVGESPGSVVWAQALINCLFRGY